MVLVLTHKILEGARLKNKNGTETLDVIVKGIDSEQKKINLVVKEADKSNYLEFELGLGEEFRILSDDEISQHFEFPSCFHNVAIGISHGRYRSGYKAKLYYDAPKK
ncbi:hypothetical protein HYX18_02750 [Candidatus Woesearchaeota archaeon]|nr:hypothetical protein [Candidatus Woesearchaeota archaeon]